MITLLCRFACYTTATPLPLSIYSCRGNKQEPLARKRNVVSKITAMVFIFEQPIQLRYWNEFAKDIYYRMCERAAGIKYIGMKREKETTGRRHSHSSR